MKKWVASLTLVAVALVATFLLWEGGVRVVVENVGAEPMRGVIVHVTGAAYPVGALAPGAKTTVVVNPKGESNVEIEQSSGPRLVVDCYFESGYTGMVTAKVSSAKVFSVNSEVSPWRFGPTSQSTRTR
jgi:hypothetical protein